MKIVVDMNLSPQWVAAFEEHGVEARHWSAVGDPRATDREIMTWARVHRWVVFTHDLDFGAILAVGGESGPSVVQVRAQDVLPQHLAPLVLAAIHQHAALLEGGALLTIDEGRSRAVVLPLKRL